MAKKIPLIMGILLSIMGGAAVATYIVANSTESKKPQDTPESSDKEG